MRSGTVTICFFVFAISAIAQVVDPYGFSRAMSNYLDSLKNVARTTEDNTIRFEAIRGLSFRYLWANPDSAQVYCDQLIELADKLQVDGMRTVALVQKSALMSVIGNYGQALNLGLEAKKLSETIGEKNFGLNIILCITYRDQGDFDNALLYAFAGLKMVDSASSPANYETALGHIGSIYEKFGQLDSALIYIDRAYVIDRRIGRDWTLLPNVMGNIYEKMGRYDLAIDYLRQGIHLAIDEYVIRDLVDMYMGLSNLFLKTGQRDSSIYFAGEIIKINKNTPFPLAAMEASNFLASVYKSENNKDSTIKYLEYAAALRDSLFSREKQREFQNISFSEELRARELDAARQQYSNKLRLNALLGSTFTLIVVAGFLIIMYRRKQKAKQKIEFAFDKLKSAQQQLIQSEKMASLGELTAGIAHEIQNPLNFVNNFSEVSSELIKEMKSELATGNLQPATEIAEDIEQNLDKIVHHGKRADGIVKGMLQHSRTGSGEREPTDINQLCDEYLRLAYHGYRAKDKSFNVQFEINFDPSLPTINVVPQDIGRVLLNLINNAFYACTERARSARVESHNYASPPESNHASPPQDIYQPMVTVTIHNLGETTEIRVKDNGKGIPDTIKEKIFQPFFTTKPTGQGTGLGLSLSYDIVKAHGGELKVESIVGAGSDFTIQLPNGKLNA